ncbi:hypothetical protein RHMOL_Rhmol01G0291400 [Rhododendron molle]|uniref:Uncharacterized protein n=1 Tax=Rhododendron molle TaxID=49168 RepID=A0ACC0Q8N3_RHOML|nr:hypothetical protein RHMOL_Rhmol01G0291400 [Rhododendron molle]
MSRRENPPSLSSSSPLLSVGIFVSILVLPCVVDRCFLTSSNETIANLKDAGTLITNQTKRDIGEQWKNLSNEHRQKYKDLAKLAKEELAKHKALLPPKPRKKKIQNRISLKSIVRIVQKLSANQRRAVQLIGLGGILELRCTALNHPLCNWLVQKFDPISRSLTVHGRTFLLTDSHVHECLGINAQGQLIELEGNTSVEFSEVYKNLGMTNGVVQLKELREYLEKTEEVDDVFKRKFALYILGCFLCPTTKSGVTRSLINVVSDVAAMANQNWANLTLDFLCKGILDQRDKDHVQPSGCLFLLVVFYLDRVSPRPIVMPYVRKFPSLLVWGDSEIKSILHRFDQIGGYDREGVVVHFTLEEKTSGNEGGVSQISTGDVTVMTNTLATIAGLLLRQNILMAKHLGSEMPSKLEPQMGQEMDLNNVNLQGELAALLAGVHTCQTSTSNLFQNPDPSLNQSKAVSTNPWFASHICAETPSKLQPQMGQEMDLNNVHLQGEFSALLAGVHTCQTSTPNLFQIPDLALNQSSKAVSTNPWLASHLCAETSSKLQPQTAQEMDLNHVHLEGVSSPFLTQVHTCQSSSPNLFKTPDLGSEMPSQLQPQTTQEMDLNHVHPSREFSPQLTGVHKTETSTPNQFKTPDHVLHKSKAVYDMPTSSFDQYNMGTDTRNTRKRRIQQDMDVVVCSPSPVKGFKSRGGLSRGRKKKLPNAYPISSFCVNDNVEVYDEPLRLRQPNELKKSHFQRSPFTKDGLKKRNPPNKQAKTQSTIIVDNLDVNVPTFCGRYGKFKSLQFAGVQELNSQTKPYIRETPDCARKSTSVPLNDLEKLFTAFIFDPCDPFTGDSYVHLKMFSTERFFATRSELCCLKPGVWILDTILNLVAVQMTNAERLLYPDKRHFMWYLPVTVSRQILDNPNLNDCDLKKLCRSYFGDANFTADLSSCSMLEGLHRALLFQYGELYQVDVTKFNIANVERQPLQHEEDGYDCGLFVIKFMQGFNFSSGVHRMDDTERPRLLLELCGDKNNRDALEVINKFEAWKAERGKTGFVTGRFLEELEDYKIKGTAGSLQFRHRRGLLGRLGVELLGFVSGVGAVL